MDEFLINDSNDMNDSESVNFILKNTLVEEQLNFIIDQIRNPFDSSNSNQFKRLCKLVKDKDTLDEYCSQLLDELENTYSGLEFDLSEYDVRLEEFFGVVYKFFVKNVGAIMYTFLKNYILQTKNRKALTAEYLNTKLPNYPKEQYGKKEYFILMIKLSNILKDIKREKLTLSEFIRYIQREEECPAYINKLKNYLDNDLILDQSVVSNLFDEFFDSDIYDETYCKLQMMITTDLIAPYLEENGMKDMWLPPLEPEDNSIQDEDEEGEEENGEST